VIKEAGYDGLISVESPVVEESQYERVLAFLKKQWDESF
jgi:sugar phosphate isomerase/epimerase